MPIIKRPPNDQFTFRLYFQLINKIKVPFDPIYSWSPVFDPSYKGIKWDPYEGKGEDEYEIDYRYALIDSIRNELVVLGIKDHLTNNNYNPWKETVPVMVQNLKDLFNFYSQKTFILLTSLENLEVYIDSPNCKIIPWGGDITNQQTEYQNLEPILEKNFDSRLNYLCLNRNPRSHRAALVSLLYGMNLQSSGLISCMFYKDITNIDNFLEWDFDSKQISIQKNIVDGFNLLQNEPFSITDDRNIYKTSLNDNVSNFKNKLSHYYKDTFVEIISETSFTEKPFLLTEKTLNSIYGMSFPILICSKGSVEFLRTIGFDMFDDIIDHSYDTIENPIDRLFIALEKNRRILSDNKYVKDLWIKNQSRLELNVKIAKTKMYDFYRNRTTEKFDFCLNELGLL